MRLLLLIGLGLGLVAGASAQAPAAAQVTPNLADNIERPLRYHPDGAAFVITNGGEFFNRPLYGGNTAFRVDAGDQPEFALYLPGRGGNLRLGLRTAAGAKWLHEAATIEARYLPGLMVYVIRDPLLGADGVLRLTAVALPHTDGLVVRAEFTGSATAVELVGAFGGVSGQRGRRDGDIGTESVPISEWFQFKAENCVGNEFQINGASFVLRAKAATLRGQWPADAVLRVVDATSWNSPREPSALGSAGSTPILWGQVALRANQPVFLGIQRTYAAPAEDLAVYREVRVERADPSTLRPPAASLPTPITDWPQALAEAEDHFAELRNHVRVETPDPYLNAAVGALNVAADAVWDEPQQAIMHGAIAWRTQLLGWRGPYALDALGWPQRARANFESWLGRQNTSPILAQLPPADAAANLARSEAGLHSNGDLSNSHYDMNLGFIDALFRHLLWTGDTAFAQQAWPVIERHLAWERRLFRREFGAEKLPLYEAYAAIWASDDLQYSGGGTAHASAYNYWHNRMAARIAPLVGADPAPYTREADLIARAMRELLWTGDHFAESKDLLGRQLVHPSAGLWTFYHTMDAGLVNDREADLMAEQVIRRAAIPVRGPGVPTDAGYEMMPSTDWLPYTWSLNNVVMGENVHTALGLWQADRPEEAYILAKSSLLASMFMGICPGNVGSMNYLDVYRRESQRDFADGSGVLSRALVEGLFGIQPDALAGELAIAPNLPAQWEQARLVHPAVEFSFQREELQDIYRIKSSGGPWRRLRLQLRAQSDEFTITVNGRKFPATLNLRNPRSPLLKITAPLDEAVEVRIVWSDRAPVVVAKRLGWMYGHVEPTVPSGDFETLALATFFNDRVTEIFRPGKYVSPRSPFVSLALPAQGIGYWAGHVNATADIDDTGLRAAAAAHGGRLTLPNGVPFATPGPGEARNIAFVSQWDNYPREVAVPLTGKARRVHLLMAGSTNAMQSRLDNGEVIATYADGTTARLALRNPETWWPVEQDYFTDDYQFRLDAPLPVRVDLKTGRVRVLDAATFKGRGGVVPGGAATVLELELDPAKQLRSLTVRALANDVVIGLMAATLER